MHKERINLDSTRLLQHTQNTAKRQIIIASDLISVNLKTIEHSNYFVNIVQVLRFVISKVQDFENFELSTMCYTDILRTKFLFCKYFYSSHSGPGLKILLLQCTSISWIWILDL